MVDGGLVTRRSLVSSMLAVGTLYRRNTGYAKQQLAYPLSNGLEVRDYRLFPDNEENRFLVEVYNTTDKAIDTPSVGAIIPHLQPEENFGWATPMHQVLHPKSSAGLIGVTPSAVRNESDWGTPEWVLCDEVVSDKAESIAQCNVDYSHTVTINGINDITCTLSVRNNGDPLPTTVTILGLVRGEDDRICGQTVPIYLNSVQPGEKKDLKVRFGPSVSYIANPKDLINTEKGVTVDFSLQPWPSAINPGCPPVLPWNR